MNRPLKLLLVDDHTVVREGLRALLQSDPRFDIVGEAADGVSAVAATAKLQPDVVLMDVSLPGLNGVVATKQLKQQRPETLVVALTVHEEAGYLRSLLDAGAAGYVLKRSAASELVRAIEAVADGGNYIDPGMTSHLVGKFPRHSSHSGPTPVLSERETQVVQLVARGYSNKEIALQLDVSVKTVETYRYRAVDKLGLRSRADLVRYALERGWLESA